MAIHIRKRDGRKGRGSEAEETEKRQEWAVEIVEWKKKSKG